MSHKSVADFEEPVLLKKMMMIWIYRLLYLPIFFCVLPIYLKRMWRRGGYGDGFMQRLGCVPFLPKKTPLHPRIWIQAVSVGELQSIKPLVEGFLSHGYEIILTTTTSTGFAWAKKNYSGRVLHVGLFPLDFWPFSALAWRRIDPDRVLHVDSELWPEHLHQANVRNIPLDVCNARVSDRSFQRYLKIRWLARYLLGSIRYLLVSNALDYERFIAIGRKPEGTCVTGNLKFDQGCKQLLSEDDKQAFLRNIGLLGVGEGQPLVLLGSSTWDQEEVFLVNVFLAALKSSLAVVLILVPRHPERRLQLQADLNALGVRYHFRSLGEVAPAGTQVYVVDKMGELDDFTALSDLALIGKSFPPHVGGQSPIAAAAFGVPMIFGPEMSNFRSLASELVGVGGALQVADFREGETVLLSLLKSSDKRNALSSKAQTWYLNNQGASQRTLHYLLSGSL